MTHTVTRHDGLVNLTHDPSTGAITVDFERLETIDAVLPQYRLNLTMEHVAAWAGHLLNGRRWRELSGQHDARRFALALRLTAADSDLVYFTYGPESVVVLRGGRVLKALFQMDESVGRFRRELGEADDGDGETVGSAFVEYLVGMV